MGLRQGWGRRERRRRDREKQTKRHRERCGKPRLVEVMDGWVGGGGTETRGRVGANLERSFWLLRNEG